MLPTRRPTQGNDRVIPEPLSLCEEQEERLLLGILRGEGAEVGGPEEGGLDGEGPERLELGAVYFAEGEGEEAELVAVGEGVLAERS